MPEAKHGKFEYITTHTSSVDATSLGVYVGLLLPTILPEGFDKLLWCHSYVGLIPVAVPVAVYFTGNPLQITLLEGETVTVGVADTAIVSGYVTDAPTQPDEGDVTIEVGVIT